MKYIAILAGGSGTRFWPLSRRHRPKQFLKVLENKSFLQATISRACRLLPKENIFVLTDVIYSRETTKHLDDFGIPRSNLILEPQGKNTLPSIALFARLTELKDKNAKLLVLPCDHYINNVAGFKKCVLQAFDLAEKGFLCLIGIKPNAAKTGYGYIKVANKLSGGVRPVLRFIEKPQGQAAKRLFKQENIFWNSGIFCFKSQVILSELRLHQLGLYNQILRISRVSDIKKVWKRIRPVSIDYGILEKAGNLCMVAAGFDWSDVGSWDALCDLLPKDKNGNAAILGSDYVCLDSQRNLFGSYCRKKLIAAVGVEDLAIIDTADALLVCKKSGSQNIKRLVQALKKKRKKSV